LKTKPLAIIEDPVYHGHLVLYVGCPYAAALKDYAEKVKIPPREEDYECPPNVSARFTTVAGWKGRGGLLWMRKRKPSPEDVAHECLHATARVLSQVGVRPMDGGDDEPYAYYLSYLIREVNRALKRKQ
jgi:hypothetical protein